MRPKTYKCGFRIHLSAKPGHVETRVVVKVMCLRKKIKNGGNKMFENYRTFSTDLAGRKLTVETGKMAQLANGSCLVRYG